MATYARRVSRSWIRSSIWSSGTGTSTRLSASSSQSKLTRFLLRGSKDLDRRQMQSGTPNDRGAERSKTTTYRSEEEG